MVLLGAKEGEKELGCGRNVGGGQSVGGGELRRARGFWPFKANQGGGGRWFGGRCHATLMAGRGQRLRQRHGRARWVPRRRRGVSSSSCRLWRARRLSGTRQARRDGEGEVSGGRAGRVLMARQRAAGQWRSEHTRGALECLRSCAEQRGEGQREREREERSGERLKMSTV